MRKSILAALSIAAFVFTSSVASAQVCVVGIFIAAIHVSAKENRELTSKEAMTCGLSYAFEDKKEQPKKKEVAHRAKRHEQR